MAITLGPLAATSTGTLAPPAIQAMRLEGGASCRCSKRLVVIVFDAPAHKAKVIEIVEAYKQRFGQYGVFRVEQPVCAGL